MLLDIDFAKNFHDLFSFSAVVSMLTLTVMEIVLGIDNVIFIAIVAGKLPREKQARARAIGLTLALVMRICLLISIVWILGLNKPLFTISGFDVTWRDIILMAGGIFLTLKTAGEINNKIKGKDDDQDMSLKKISVNTIIMQIVFIDIIFSFDSILAAVTLVRNNVLIMIIAVIFAMIIMLISSGKVSDFINRHPTVKMLALAFLLMVAIFLMMDACHLDVATLKPYMYFSMAFAFAVEMLNMRMRKRDRLKKKS